MPPAPKPSSPSGPRATRLPFAVQLLIESAERLGWNARVLDPEFGYLWEVELPDGRRRALVGAKTPVNDGAAAQLASDKHYSGQVLAARGFRVPRSVRALSPLAFRNTDHLDATGLRPALAFAEELGFPVFVKPNRMSHGRLVRRVRDAAALEEAVRAAWELDRVALVQAPVEGRELRIDLLDGEFLAGYERRPVEVTGDGTSTLVDLLVALDRRFRDAGLRARLVDDRSGRELCERHGDLDAWTPARGETVTFDDGVLNLNRSATARVIPELPEPWRAWCTDAADALGLRLAGIDLRIPCEGDPLAADPARATVIEVNGTPLLAQLARLGRRNLALDAQMRILRAAFLD